MEPDTLDTPIEVPPAPPQHPAPLASLVPADTPQQNVLAPLAELRAEIQPIARDMLCDRAYWEFIKRNSSPRTLLEFVRFAFAADLEGKTGGNNTQVIVNAPFPRGPLDVLPPQMQID
jgi:hypothetical protein